MVTLGAGGLALAAMGGFDGLAVSEHDALAAGCGASRTCQPADLEMADTFALVADVNFGIGGVLAATGIVLLIFALATGDHDAESAFELQYQRHGLAGMGVVRW